MKLAAGIADRETPVDGLVLAFANQPHQVRTLCFRQINPPLDLHVNLPLRKAPAYDLPPITTRQNDSSFHHQFLAD